MTETENQQKNNLHNINSQMEIEYVRSNLNCKFTVMATVENGQQMRFSLHKTITTKEMRSLKQTLFFVQKAFLTVGTV